MLSRLRIIGFVVLTASSNCAAPRCLSQSTRLWARHASVLHITLALPPLFHTYQFLTHESANVSRCFRNSSNNGQCQTGKLLLIASPVPRYLVFYNPDLPHSPSSPSMSLKVSSSSSQPRVCGSIPNCRSIVPSV